MSSREDLKINFWCLAARIILSARGGTWFVRLTQLLAKPAYYNNNNANNNDNNVYNNNPPPIILFEKSPSTSLES